VRSFGITSQFNYSVTKKRLLMMTKKTSATAAWISRLALMPVLIIAFMLFCNKTQAVERMVTGSMMMNNMMVDKTLPGDADTAKAIKKHDVQVIFSDQYPYTQKGVPAALVREYAALEAKYGMDKQPDFKKFKQISAADRTRLEEIYKQMSQDQQRQATIIFSYGSIPKPLQKVAHDQLLEWADNPKTYGVWVNNKRFDNGDLTTYQAEDLGLLWTSILTPVAIKKDGFKIQVTLMTRDFYAKYKRDALTNRFKARMYFRSALSVVTEDKTAQIKPDAVPDPQVYRWVDYRYLAPGFADLRKKTPGC